MEIQTPMRSDSKLWRKSAVLGSLWASFEIVLGSFLHNAQFPLSGHVMTAIAIALLVAGRRLWPEKGLLWRAGLICAAMKSVSPSAFLLSPMIAIAIEGGLLELGVSIGGGGSFGLILGGGLAMSWNLFHKAAKLLVFYGPSAAAVYVRGLHSILPATSPWIPLAALWAAHLAGGCLAAAFGLSVGRPAAATVNAPLPALPPARSRVEPRSPFLLFLHLGAIAGLLFALSAVGLLRSTPFFLGYVALCLIFYPNALRRLRRPRLWLGLIGFCVLAGVVLGRPVLGAEMALRALALSAGFAAVGAELRNPLLRGWLERLGARSFFSALDAAFETLPAVLSAAPSGRALLRRPLASLRETLAQAPYWLERIEQRAPVHILTGEKGAGKSALVAELSRRLRGEGKAVGGIHAPGIWDQGERAGFDVVDLGTGLKSPLCRADGPADWEPQGRFRFSPEGLRFGLQSLARARERDVDYLVIDEVGPLELRGEGWARELDRLAAEWRKPMLWVVRPSAIEDVRRHWDLDVTNVWEAGRSDAEQIARALNA